MPIRNPPPERLYRDVLVLGSRITLTPLVYPFVLSPLGIPARGHVCIKCGVIEASSAERILPAPPRPGEAVNSHFLNQGQHGVFLMRFSKKVSQHVVIIIFIYAGFILEQAPPERGAGAALGAVLLGPHKAPLVPPSIHAAQHERAGRCPWSQAVWR